MKRCVATSKLMASFALISALCGATSGGDDNTPSSLYPPGASQHFRVLSGDISRGQLFEKIIAGVQKGKSKSVLLSDAATFNLYGPFVFPPDTTFDVIEQQPRANALFGIDISHYTAQALPIESLWESNVRFVYAKASQGVAIRDGNFAAFWSRLGALKEGRRVRRGAYHFLSADSPVDRQAATFLSVLADNGGLKPTDMPPVLDLEWDYAGQVDRWQRYSADAIIAKALAWLSEVKARTNRTPMLYTNAQWWGQQIKSDSRIAEFSQYLLWIADYSKSSRGVETPTTPNSAPWALWQFTEASHLADRFKDGLDATVYRGSEEAFAKTFELADFSAQR